MKAGAWRSCGRFGSQLRPGKVFPGVELQGVHAAARDQVPQLREEARRCDTCSSQVRAKREDQRSHRNLAQLRAVMLAAATGTRF